MERAIGILKRRFRLLRQGLEILNRPFLCLCFRACCFLHNYLMDLDDFCLDSDYELLEEIVEATP